MDIDTIDVIDEDLNFRGESTNVPSSTNGNFNMRKAADPFYIPKYSKGPLGEDAHIICIEGETIGIADGVGGWAKKGIDSGEYSRQLPDQAQNYNMVSAMRIGRWHNVKQSGVFNVRTTIDSSEETFQWRPYALAEEGWIILEFYNEKEEWAIVEGKILDQELESFIRCLRVSELVGLDCQEPYRPNRVAMQLGYDQDFPKWIPRLPSSPGLALYNYIRPIDSDLRLYYPSRFSESDVTTKYLKMVEKRSIISS
ncbi:hypothetical protein HAX54_005410 [Datura stramonium]|uniref:Aminotransferase-like plant mobile domain-containing protein n=1 Tax=Datura stramonium TaxID=4076 RepID=A0ABS8TAC3_DATST|nr:hypothetical protein [Datura stramonium]